MLSTMMDTTLSMRDKQAQPLRRSESGLGEESGWGVGHSAVELWRVEQRLVTGTGRWAVMKAEGFARSA